MLRSSSVLRWLVSAFALAVSSALLVQGNPAVGVSDSPAVTEQLDLPTPGNPIAVGENYTLLTEEVFNSHPEEWGGAFVDGDNLVVLTVTRSIAEATTYLSSLNITRGIDVRQAAHSLTELDAAVETILEDGLPTGASSVGPQYSLNSIVVGISDETQFANANLPELPEDSTVDVIYYKAANPETD